MMQQLLHRFVIAAGMVWLSDTQLRMIPTLRIRNLGAKSNPWMRAVMDGRGSQSPFDCKGLARLGVAPVLRNNLTRSWLVCKLCSNIGMNALFKVRKVPPSSVPRLNRNNPMPLHAQAEHALREMIRRPEHQAAGLLPDEVSLARCLGISRNTLRMAIGRLVAEGRLERRAGIGTRIVEPRVKSGVGAWHSFTQEMAANGIKVETYSVKIKSVPVSGEACRALQIAPDTEVLCLDRVRGWDGEPEFHFRSYLHPRLGLSGDEDFSHPLYQLIEQHCSVIADQSLEELTAVPAAPRLARLLAVRVGVPLLRRERIVLDTGRRPVEYAIVHYRCERFRLTLNLRQE